MSKHSPHAIVASLLADHGCTYAEEIGIPLEDNSPESLFRLLSAVLLFSIRINARVAVKAARKLAEKGWTTAGRMAASTWEERVRALDEAEYVRYDEGASRRLGAMAEKVLDKYRGDLRNLREEAGRDPARIRALLEEFKGIGDVGADIFLREVQVVWDEAYPFADGKALRGARDAGLAADARSLARLVSRRDFPRLVSALVRIELGRGQCAEKKVAAGV